MEGMVAFLLAGLALVGSPGPATLSLAAAGAAFGSQRSWAYLAGLIVGLVGTMAITASGVLTFLFAVPGARPVVLAASAAYFVYLAFRIATAPPLHEAAGERRPPSFSGGVFLSLVNPKGYAAMAALFSGFVLFAGRVALDVVVKMAVITVMAIAINIAWLKAGAAITGLFRDPRANRIINVGFAVLLLLSLAVALWL
jgi:threonine/homoserine/homoserine lactone efflux protein